MYSMHRQRQQRRQRFKPRLIRFVLLLAICGLVFNYLRPLPHADASVASLADTAQKISLSWPATGSAAIGAQDFGVLETHGSGIQKPTASIAKLITALAVLDQKPLAKGEQGPVLTLSQADVELFNKYYAIGGSYVKIEAGEKITEYQALQAILLPSANNMADSLAVWAFGSMDSYHTYANEMIKKAGLADTVVADDASGMSPASKSTPSDLVRLGSLALQNPVVAEIVRQPSATIPVHGIIYSANSRLGYDDIIGIKTGLTDEAGGCFLFAANYTVDGKSVTIIGVITGQPNLTDALRNSSPLIQSAKKYFTVKTPVKAGEVFATLTTPWLTSAQVVAKDNISLVSWNGAALIPNVQLAGINRSLPAGAQVGTAIISSGDNKATTPLVLQEAISGPSWQWRMKRF
jgi:D-alanyl-D-alanine carboxypeptidase (penicillin-binding protein 5/6)